jgi:hypothetical protein
VLCTSSSKGGLSSDGPPFAWSPTALERLRAWAFLGQILARLHSMRIYCVDQLHQGSLFRLSPLRGDLRFYPGVRPRARRLPDRVQEVLSLCDNPYLLEPDGPPDGGIEQPRCVRHARVVLRRMLKLPTLGFTLSRLYAAYRVPLFPDSRSAIAWFNANTPAHEHGRLCLPRALFAAKTSDSFSASGAVVIGTLLPTRNLHAWVIEGRRQPDDSDRAWVCYRPIGVLI